VIDDILDFSSSEKILGKPVVSDLKEGKLTLPLVYALDQCSSDEAKKIETVLKEHEFRTVSSREILAIVEKYRTLEKGRAVAQQFADEAQTALNVFEPSPYRDALHAIPQFILEREK
jgi:octaprenyl-diphosphate synthase